ncbi:hypothetical protein AKN88_09715 [Thiopseudomonas alkaliphila]|uniref:Macro domain-containing protein n=1 Tax=Thiopseudomonas alkaliphila TaxID=1697053 RepID=A0A0K1XG77_9GAMM|nr:macro domain-containing protein [Thiopseudomonas alkaliphila]AKX60172.1 hypothetical protein AKN88_09715 [Thiopseudomonas alkaliphila]
MKQIYLVVADIFNVTADAMVNPAHETLQAGSGLCYLTHKKAGPDLTQACLQLYHSLGKRPVSSVSATAAGNLDYQYVLHAVTPDWLAANPEQLLAQTYQNILRLADQLQLHSVAIPALTTGIHGLNKDLVAKVALTTLTTHLPQTNYVNRIILVCHELAMLKAYQRINSKQIYQPLV